MKQTLFAGQREIDEAWVRTFHETGRLIVSHILLHQRADYGTQVYRGLARDTGSSERKLYGCAQFPCSFPILRRVAEWGWNRCRLLCQVSDAEARLELAAAAKKHDWPSRFGRPFFPPAIFPVPLCLRGSIPTMEYTFLRMHSRSLTPRVRAALRRLAAGPQDMRDEALLREINDEMRKLPVEDVAYIRDRVRFSCPPCPMVQSVVLMLNGLIELKNLKL